jgi:hypothetical protein
MLKHARDHLLDAAPAVHAMTTMRLRECRRCDNRKCKPNCRGHQCLAHMRQSGSSRKTFHVDLLYWV